MTKRNPHHILKALVTRLHVKRTINLIILLRKHVWVVLLQNPGHHHTLPILVFMICKTPRHFLIHYTTWSILFPVTSSVKRSGTAAHFYPMIEFRKWPLVTT